MPSKKGVGLNPSGQSYFTDHLAVICVLMGIPLLFIDETDYEMGQKYYPGLHAQKADYDELTPEFLIANYDVLFLSEQWDRHTFHEKFHLLEMKYGKMLRHVHVPHGFSDKGFYLRKTANEDIPLLYGQNMLDMLKHYGVFSNLRTYVISGNYRYSFYNKHRDFFEKIFQDEVGSRFANPEHPMGLYAPTWKDLEESTSFFEGCSSIVDGLPHGHNLVIKLHPRLELDDPGLFYHLVGKYEKKPNVLFLKDFPLVYPLLAKSSYYIGDMSSVGYDFLPFNRPMFFLNQQKRDSKNDRGLTLFQCGVEIQPEQYGETFKIIEREMKTDQERFSEIRQKMDEYTFGEERAFSDIKKDIVKAYNDPYEV